MFPFVSLAGALNPSSTVDGTNNKSWLAEKIPNIKYINIKCTAATSSQPNNKTNKLAPYGTDGRLLLTANLKDT